MEVEIDRQWKRRVEREGENYSDTPGEESSPVPAGRDEMREREYVCNVYTIHRRVIWSGAATEDGGIAMKKITSDVFPRTQKVTI